MAATALRPEERIGLALAVAAHVALVALLVWQPGSKPVVLPPERMTVTISDEVGLTSTSPEPAAQAAPDVAPDLGEPAPAEPEPAPPVPQPIARPEPAPPPPRPVTRPAPPRPVAKPAPAPRPAPPRVQPPRPQPAARPARPTARAQPAPRQPARPAGASRIGNDFLKGTPGAQNTGQSRNPPAAAAGPQVRMALSQSVLRKVRPNWQGRVPQGVNTEKLVTILSIELNRDGTLARTPRVTGQEGVDDSNRAQAGRHAEEAIKAVQLSQPFDLPDELYDAWKNLPPLRFRKST